MNKLISRSFLNALGTAVYIAVIATVLQNGDKLFRQMDNWSSPIAFLMLLVLSAAITASLVLGKPILMYMDGNKQEAVKMFLYTLGWLAVGVVILFLFNLK